MDRNNSQVEKQNLNNLIDSVATERNIYITATNICSQKSIWLNSTPWLNLAFYVIHRSRSDTNPTREAEIVCSCYDFSHGFDRFASAEEAKALVATMFSQQKISFSFDLQTDQRLHWKDHITDDSSAVPEQAYLQNFDDVVSRISEAAVSITRAALVSGHGFVWIAVTIDKRTVVPQQEFDRVIPHHVELSDIWDHENPELYLKIGLYYNGHYVYRGSLIYNCDPLNNDRRELDQDQAVLNDDEMESTMTIEETFSQLALDSRSVPAAKSAEEKFRYERRIADEVESKTMT